MVPLQVDGTFACLFRLFVLSNLCVSPSQFTWDRQFPPNSRTNSGTSLNWSTNLPYYAYGSLSHLLTVKTLKLGKQTQTSKFKHKASNNIHVNQSLHWHLTKMICITNGLTRACEEYRVLYVQPCCGHSGNVNGRTRQCDNKARTCCYTNESLKYLLVGGRRSFCS